MASTNITRTCTAGNRRKWTWSAWIKRTATGTEENLFTGYESSTTYTELKFNASDELQYQNRISNTWSGELKTNRQFRDVNCWYHIVIVWDSENTNSASQRMRMYINGAEESSFATRQNPSNPTDSSVNWVSRPLIYGSWGQNSRYFNGCMSHVHFIDGTVYSSSDFGETDSTTGEWKIKTSVSVTYGTNGSFILKDGNSLTDQSGESNNFSAGTGTLTKTEDCPSNVFATFNPLARNASNTYANGNTTYDYANNYQKTTSSTLATNNKKIYAEFKKIRNSNMHFGIVGDTFISDGRTVNDTGGSWTYDMRGHTGAIALQSDTSGSTIFADGSNTSTSVFTSTTNDIIMVAFDPTTKKIWFGKNGTWHNSGNPATGANASYTYSGTATSDFCFAVASEGSSAGAISANFGNGYFGTTAVSSAGTNASGNGIFEYDVPANFTALSTKGLNL